MYTHENRYAIYIDIHIVDKINNIKQTTNASQKYSFSRLLHYNVSLVSILLDVKRLKINE